MEVSGFLNLLHEFVVNILTFLGNELKGVDASEIKAKAAEAAQRLFTRLDDI